MEDVNHLSFKTKIQTYWELTKPDITFLILISTFLGYFLGVQFIGGNIFGNPLILLHLLIGSILSSSGVAILNEYIERDQDAIMNRTSKRPLPSGKISPINALFFGIVISVIGVLELALFVNLYCGILSFFTVVFYLFIYTPMKQKTPWNTLVGAIPGALPPVGGWFAVTNEFTSITGVLFAIMFCWQIPHFLSLAYIYSSDYKKGGFIMLPSLYSNQVQTRVYVVFFTLLLIIITFALYFSKIVGISYLVLNMILSTVFIYFVYKFVESVNLKSAKQLFFASIIYLPILLILIIISS